MATMEQAFVCVNKAVKTYVEHIIPMTKSFVDSMKDNDDYKPETCGACMPVKCVRTMVPWPITFRNKETDEAYIHILKGGLSLELRPHDIYVSNVKVEVRSNVESLTIDLSVGADYIKKHYGKADDEEDVYVIPAPVVAVPAPTAVPVRTRGTGKYKTHTRKSRAVEGDFTGWFENVEDFVDALVKKTIAPAKADVLKNVVADHIHENEVYFERTDKDQHYMISWENVGEVQSKTVKVRGKDVVKHLYNVHYKRDVSDESFVDIVEED
jgi:hypothetical protein